MALNGDKTMPSARRPNDRALTSGPHFIVRHPGRSARTVQ